MSTALWVKLGSKGSSRVPCEKRGLGFRAFGFRVGGLGLRALDLGLGV